MKLTKTVIEATTPDPERHVFLWDDHLQGFGLRVTMAGAKSFVVQYRTGRRSRRLTVGRYPILTVEAARKAAQQLLAAAARGEDPAGEREEARAAITVKELAERYLEAHAETKKKPRSVVGDRRMLELYILKRFGSERVVDVTREQIARLHHDLRKKPYMANRVVALVSKMFNLAERWGYRPEGTNPARWVEKYPEKARRRYLSATELGRLGKVLSAAAVAPARPPRARGEERDEETIYRENEYALLGIRLLMYTGARLSEILTLEWSHVDLQHGLLMLPDSKTGAKTIPLSGAALRLLAEAPREEGHPFVIAGRRPGTHLTDLSGPWGRIRKWAGIPDVRIHDLRHTFASVGAGAGYGLPQIGALLGHTQAATTNRYAHLHADPLRLVADAIAGELEAALEGRESADVVKLRTEGGTA